MPRRWAQSMTMRRPLRAQARGQRPLGELDVTFLSALDSRGAADAVGRSEQRVSWRPSISPSISQLDVIGELVAVGTEQLDAVIVVAVMRGRDHDAEIGAQASASALPPPASAVGRAGTRPYRPR